MNQGTITCLFTMASIYTAIVFYFKFNEALSWSKIAGIGLMICAVVCITLDKKEDGATAADGTELTIQEQKIYGLIAVLFGAVLAPTMFTIKSYFGRLAIENNNEFPMFDLGFDQMMF